MKPERVQKWIALSGYCSRRKAETLIASRRVKVNNKVVSLGDKCLPTDKIQVNNLVIKVKLDFDYIIMNKQIGYVTTNSDELNRKTVLDLLSYNDRKSNLFSVGRLDKETSGLLILTNDGSFAQRIIHPSKKIAKEYLVTLDKALDSGNKNKIEKGLKIDGYQLKPCKIKVLSNNKYIVTIYEGRKRQIRKMFEKCDFKVLKLHREKIGNLDLKQLKLKLGEYRKVSIEFLEKNIF